MLVCYPTYVTRNNQGMLVKITLNCRMESALILAVTMRFEYEGQISHRVRFSNLHGRERQPAKILSKVKIISGSN